MPRSESVPAREPADSPDAAGRPTRRDARRNRERLITAAQEIFREADGPVSLESVARRAGVGIGTLYRHFPTREDLVDAVYAAELADVTADVSALLAQFPPDLALRTWMDRYAMFVATKQGMMDTLRAGFASGRIARPTRERVTKSIATFLAAGSEAGTLRPDVAPEDVTALLLGVFVTITPGDASGQTGRLLDLVVDGLRIPTSAVDRPDH
ncbi:TetR/AcrR family transcriptional regulator [Streptomyces sp. NPDC056296]|uniref:TetR/AcrR family transcriptional regulator n=1 Tax=Streptomyces sp. NPDC056296 TaxID=3345775 RepID=UPI0035D590E0